MFNIAKLYIVSIAVCFCSIGAAYAQKNVVLIIADDLNTKVGCYGDPQAITPNIDRLAAKGVKFQRAYCNHPLCGPSRASFLSGLQSWTTGIGSTGQTVRSVIPGHLTLGEHLKARGYHTTAIGKVDHDTDNLPWDHVDRVPGFGLALRTEGFVWPGMAARPAAQKTSDVASPTFFGASGDMRIQQWDSSDDQFVDGQIAARSIAAIDERVAAGGPFMVAAGFFSPHQPYIAPKQYFDLYDPATLTWNAEPPRASQNISWWALPTSSPFRNNPVATPEQRAEWIQAYRACTSYTDAMVGLILDRLDQDNLWDNTIVVFFSDNGFLLGEHEIGWGKQRLFEEALRVPLIIWDPDAAGNGQTCNEPVSLIDVFPTIIQAAGLPMPSQRVDGQSLTHYLSEPELDLGTKTFHVKEWTAFDSRPAGRSLTMDRWNYSEYRDGSLGLYDLEADPFQVANLAVGPEYADLMAVLSKEFPSTLSLSGSTFYERGAIPSPADRDADGFSDSEELGLFASLGFDPALNSSGLASTVVAERERFGLLLDTDISDLLVDGFTASKSGAGEIKLSINLFELDGASSTWIKSAAVPETDISGDIFWTVNPTNAAELFRVHVDPFEGGSP